MAKFDDRLHEEKAERPTTALLRKNIMNLLNRHYPHMGSWPGEAALMINRSPWLIEIKDFETGGIITIRNLMLSGKMGIVLKMDQVQTDPEGKLIVRLVGELLERYNIQREKALDIRESIYGMPRNWRGDAIAQM